MTTGHSIRTSHLILLVFCTLSVGACQRPQISASNPDLAAFIEMMIPRRIEIQKYLTRPIDVAPGENADTIEVILAAYDSFGHGVKTTGTFQFELYEQRLASGDKLGKRLAYWRVEIKTSEDVMAHWDHLSRFFKFPLAMPNEPLKPGHYVLQARFQSPIGEMLYDEYPFDYRTEPVR